MESSLIHVFIPEGPFNNISALVQVMAWKQAGAKPLPVPMLTIAYDVIWHH